MIKKDVEKNAIFVFWADFMLNRLHSFITVTFWYAEIWYAVSYMQYVFMLFSWFRWYLDPKYPKNTSEVNFSFSILLINGTIFWFHIGSSGLWGDIPVHGTRSLFHLVPRWFSKSQGIYFKEKQNLLQIITLHWSEISVK